VYSPRRALILTRKSSRSFLLVAFALSVLLCLPPLAAQEASLPRCEGLNTDGLRIATGPEGGSYELVGKILREFLPDLDIHPCRTQGTPENPRLLSENKVQFAIGQGDVLHKGWSHEAPPDSYRLGNQTGNDWSRIHFKNIKLVRWLYSEKAQIVAAPHTYITVLADLRKKHIWLGPTEGGLNDTVMSWSNWLAGRFYRRAAALHPDRRHRVILNWGPRAAELVTDWAGEKKAVRGEIRVVTLEPIVLPPQLSADALRTVPSMLTRRRVQPSNPFVLATRSAC
jgi:NMT1 family protein